MFKKQNSYPEILSQVRHGEISNKKLRKKFEYGTSTAGVFSVSPTAKLKTKDPQTPEDVDHQLYQAIDERDAERFENLSSGRDSSTDFINIVAEGDSWFRFPFGKAIAGQLRDSRRLGEDFRVRNIAFWGHTLSHIVAVKQYQNFIRGDTDFLLLSAGGNDLQIVHSDPRLNLIGDYEAGKVASAYLTDEASRACDSIRHNYLSLLNDVLRDYRRLTVVCHGYDYPRPRRRRYFGLHVDRFLDSNIPSSMARRIMEELIDLLHDSILSAVNQCDDPSRVVVVDCRDRSGPWCWFDDMHPNSIGFGRLAAKFEEVILDRASR